MSRIKITTAAGIARWCRANPGCEVRVDSTLWMVSRPYYRDGKYITQHQCFGRTAQAAIRKAEREMKRKAR